MDNKNYIPTAPLYDRADNHGTQLNLSSSQTPQANDCYARYQESELGDYSHISRSGPSSQSNQKSTASAQLYDTAYEVLDRKSDDTRVSATKSLQCNVEKMSLFILLVLILLLLVSILVMLFLASKNSCNCTSDHAGSNNAGLTDSAGVNSSLSLLQNKMDDILEQFTNNCPTNNNSLLLQNKMDDILEQFTSNCPTNNNSLLLQNKMDSVLNHIAVHDNLTNRSSDKILQLLNASLVKDIPTTAAINDILLIVHELLEMQNGSSLLNSNKPVSCKDIKAKQPSSPSGYYHVNNRTIYCNMGELCGEEGGWTNLAYLSMFDLSQRCPDGLDSSWNIRVCGLPNNSTGTCWSRKFQTKGISYTQICGRVLGYQKGTTDGIRSNTSINSTYLDGVSITRGSPREHVWSYISGLNSNAANSCPCSTGSNVTVPSFVGNDYYCESGSPGVPHNTLAYWNPLWNGICLGLESACCRSKSDNVPLPWFHRDYGNATSTNYLELRICCDEGSSNENVLVRFYEIYVK